MEILIDYLTISIKNIDLQAIFHRLRIDEYECTHRNSCFARYGMVGMFWYNGIKIHYGQYIILDISGVGCRTLETNYNNCFDWLSFVGDLILCDGHISRLDIAIDDKNKILDFKTMFNHIEKKKYISLAKSIRIVKGTTVEEIIIGSTKSDKLVRIYNKALERGFNDGEHWIRCELQLRNECAMQYFQHWAGGMRIGEVAGSTLLKLFRFVTEVYEGVHSDRFDTCRWWTKFINTTNKVSNILIGGLEYNEHKLVRYLSEQTSSSIITYLHLCDGDLDSLYSIVKGRKINQKQKMLLKSKGIKI